MGTNYYARIIPKQEDKQNYPNEDEKKEEDKEDKKWVFSKQL